MELFKYLGLVVFLPIMMRKKSGVCQTCRDAGVYRLFPGGTFIEATRGIEPSYQPETASNPDLIYPIPLRS